ncbi:MAG: CAP domain-containing protein [Elusimicrobia bacterium]|nr:CAP domain-containing protein [Elusimicrobiota bacterium]
MAHFILVLALLLTASPSPAAELDAARLERLLADGVNAERSALGLPALAWDIRAQNAARGHSREMAALDYFSHSSPTPGRTTSAERVLKEGISAMGESENLAKQPIAGRTVEVLAREITRGFMKSSGHMGNIVLAEFTHMGVGVDVSRGWVFVTQTFLIRAIPDARLAPQFFSGDSLRVAVSGRAVAGRSLAVVWRERGALRHEDLKTSGGRFAHEFLLPRSLGEVEVFLAFKRPLASGQNEFAMTDRFLVDAARGTVLPPPY